jgi:hypothetical protein
METLVKADIFFFITTIAVIFVTVVFGIIAFYVVMFLRNAREISEEFKLEAKEVVRDIRLLRGNLKDEGLRWKHVLGFLRNIVVKDTEEEKAPKKVSVRKVVRKEKEASSETVVN